MPESEPITPGVVDWTGENPGILLKHDDGSFSAMALFFRVAWSPLGQGQMLLLYGTPDSEQGSDEAPNIIISDNAELTEGNRLFGRKFRIESFRWLSENEV